jgi:hypothetical protein
MSETTNSTTKKGSVVTAIKDAVKDSVPSTVGGKVVTGITSAVIAVSSFFLGRLSNGKKK